MQEISSMLEKSPLHGVKAHVDVCMQCAEALRAVLTANKAPREAALDEVRRLEREADGIKAAVRQQLSKRLFLPVPKALILELLRREDKIANRAKDVATLYTYRFDDLPAEIVAVLHAFLDASLDVAREARAAIDELDNLITTGFRGREADRVQEMIDRVDRLEGRSDRRQWELFTRLKALEDQVPTLDAFFLYRTSMLISEIGDHADRSGRILAQMLAS